MGNTNEMMVEFDAVGENEGFARVVVAAFVSRLNPTLEELGDLKVAVSEAVTNAIIHGYDPQIKHVVSTDQEAGENTAAVTDREAGENTAAVTDREAGENTAAVTDREAGENTAAVTDREAGENTAAVTDREAGENTAAVTDREAGENPAAVTDRDTVQIRVHIADHTVTVQVKDHGRGIPDITQAMEPLFTTKPEEERSGMGFSFMEAFTDRLLVESEPGQGTCVTMVKAMGVQDGQDN